MEHTLNIKISPYCVNRDAVTNYYKRLEKSDASIGIDLITSENLKIPVNKVKTIDFDIEAGFVTKIYDIDRVYNKEEPFMLIPNDDISNTPLMMTNNISVFGDGFHSLSTVVRCFPDPDYTIGDSFDIYEGSKYFQIVAFDGNPIKVRVID
jgi:hypothetical protein